MFAVGSTEKIETPTIVPPERRRSSAVYNVGIKTSTLLCEFKAGDRRRSSRRELTEDEKEHLLAIAGRTPTPGMSCLCYNFYKSN